MRSRGQAALRQRDVQQLLSSLRANKEALELPTRKIIRRWDVSELLYK